MKKFIGEFKTFATKGNVFDLAVGIIIGGAFGKIVASFVADLFMPLLSLILGKINLSDLKVVLTEGVVDADGIVSVEELAIHYGSFIQTFIDFVLIALVVFCLVKVLNKMKKKEEEKKAADPVPTNQELLLAEIRDLLKEK